MKYQISFFLIVFFIFFSYEFSQDNEIREDMVVINVEVPVRVMHKGKPVDNLKKSDFSLYENGRQLEINGFNVVRKQISSQRIEFDSEIEQFNVPRFFVLAFSVTNFNNFYEKGVRYFFKNVLKKEDKLMIFVNSKTFSYANLDDKDNIRDDILKVLDEEGKKARERLRMISLTVENDVRNLISQIHLAPEQKVYIQDVHTKRSVLQFMLKYQTAWKSYKRSFLRLNVYTMYNFAAFLKRIKLEKWVISFYQYEKFPVLDGTNQNSRKIINNIGHESSRILNDVNEELRLEKNFPHDEVSKIFYNLGATFNLVVIPTRIESDAAEVKMSDISTSLENTLRAIADKTGGSIDFSTDLSKSLKKIVEKEDIHYLLTYAPGDSTKRGKLKIKLNGNKYKLIYDNNQRAGFLKRQMKRAARKKKIVKMGNLKFINKKLFFELINFKMGKQKKVSMGKIKVNIIIKDLSGEILFDEEKILSPEKKSTDVLIGFNWLKKGKYDLLIDVKDLLANRIVFEYLKLDVK